MNYVSFETISVRNKNYFDVLNNTRVPVNRLQWGYSSLHYNAFGFERMLALFLLCHSFVLFILPNLEMGQQKTTKGMLTFSL